MKTPAYIAIALTAAVAGFGIYHFGIAPRVAEREDRINAAEAAQVQGTAAGVPEVLPDFTLADIDDQPRSIRSWEGKSMIVNFWATWCAPCRREIPLLNKIQDEHGAEGFQIVGVAVDFREDVVKYAQEIGIDYPILIGEQDGLDAVNKFGLGSLGFPFTVFTDNQQRIVMFHVGELHPEQAEVVLDAVRKVNSGELTPAAARTVAAEQLRKLEPAAE